MANYKLQVANVSSYPKASLLEGGGKALALTEGEKKKILLLASYFSLISTIVTPDSPSPKVPKR
jgi:hypothetical protein